MSDKQPGRWVGFERLKQAISMEEVLGRYGLLGRLRRSGDNLSGVCPLHQGHNPGQFRVSLSKNCWYCFGDCHCGGSILDFVSRMENISMCEAGRLLQAWFGLKPDDWDQTPGRRLVRRLLRKEPELPVPQRPNPPLRFVLGPLDSTHPYLKARGLSAQTIATFGLGYCAWGSLQGWIAIPIHNFHGQLVAYAGRWPGTPSQGMSKYRLPRGFHKSLELFNQHRAARVERHAPLVVVEGFFGCMHVWQAGYRRVVALMGSVLSSAQERRVVELASSTRHVLLLFDEDPAGDKERWEAAARLSRSVAVTVVRLPEGQQPDALRAEELLRLLERHSQAHASP